MMDYPIWFVDQDNYEPGDICFLLAEVFLGLKWNMKVRRVDKGICYILINSSPKNFIHAEVNILSFLRTLMVESGCWLLWICFAEKINKLDLHRRRIVKQILHD